MEDHPSTTYDRSFHTLFEDGVRLLLASERNDDSDESGTFARGSIACTMMLPEVAANICIESLHLDSTIFGEVDKLSPLGKFDYYLKTRYRGKKIPVGTLPVQRLQELKRLRDVFVHPKRFLVQWTPGEGGTYIGESKRTQFLDMSTNPTMWHLDDAGKAMRGAHHFLSFFFADVCKMSRRKVTDLLFSDEVLLGEGGGEMFYYEYVFHAALKRWQVDTSYFRIGIL